MTENQDNTENTEVINEVIEGKSIANILGGDSNDLGDSSDDGKEVPVIENTEDAEVKESDKEADKEELKPETDIEKLQKNLKETQSWGHAKAREAKEHSKKLEEYEGIIKEYKEGGNLTPDEADVALKHTAHNRPVEEAVPLTQGQEIVHILRETLPEVVKYSTDPDTDQYIEAFDHMTQNMHADELNRLTEDFAVVMKDPVLMAKNMLAIGKQYNNDFYGEYKESGGVHGLARNHKNKITELQKTIDKQQKDIVKLQQNSDYTGTAGYSIPSGSSDKANTVRSRSLDGILGRAKTGKI